MKTRYTATGLTLALIVVGASACSTPTEPAPPAPAASSLPSPSATPADVSADLRALEVEFDARVGVSAVDTGTDASIRYRADERFGYASSLKALAAAEFLHDVPTDQRGEVVTWSASDVEAAGYSPVTSEHVDSGLPLSELAEAAVRRSDNTALNLVLDRLGGPTALDEGLAELGDDTTEVVNDEPALNAIEHGSTDDTSTPAAFTADLGEILRGSYLNEGDRATLLEWMSGNATGDALIRAGAPSDWVVADKSGGAGGIRNDIAVVTPPGGEPIVLTIFTARNDPERAYDDSLVARTAAIVLQGLRQ